jgi:hypothetical protein
LLEVGQVVARTGNVVAKSDIKVASSESVFALKMLLFVITFYFCSSNIFPELISWYWFLITGRRMDIMSELYESGCWSIHNEGYHQLLSNFDGAKTKCQNLERQKQNG